MARRRTREQLRLPDEMREEAGKWVMANMGLVWRVINSMPFLKEAFQNSIEDLLSIGAISLLKSFRDFKPELGFERSTPATTIITNDFLKLAKRSRRRMRPLHDGMRVQSMQPDDAADYREQLAPYADRLAWSQEKRQQELFTDAE